MDTATIPVLTIPDPKPTRYFALPFGPSIATVEATPFVVRSIQEGRYLLWAISEGRDGVDIREWRDGTVVERRTSFLGSQSDEIVLQLYVSPPADTDDPQPEVTISRGPRRGVNVERHGPPKRRREPRTLPAEPLLAADRVIP